MQVLQQSVKQKVLGAMRKYTFFDTMSRRHASTSSTTIVFTELSRNFPFWTS